MTFAEWRQRYSGVEVQLTAAAPTVYMISDRLLPGGPLADLRELTDYMVTTEALEAHYGPTIWIAPRVERDDWTRAEYLNHCCTHHAYYMGIAKRIGIGELESLVRVIASPVQLVQHINDPMLNRIPLAKWDALHPAVQSLVRMRNRATSIMALSWNGQVAPGTICWSMSESVCVLKAVARDMIERERAKVVQL